VRSVVRLLLTVVMNVLLVVAALLLARIVIGFFGRFDASPLATQFMDLTAPLVRDLGFDAIKTPYGGTFDVDAGVMLVVAFAAEWLVAVVRRFSH